MGSTPDSSVWEYVNAHGYLLVSKDSDFHERTLLHGYPPKVVLIKRGNCSTSEIETLLRDADWPHSSIRRYIRDGIVPADWGTAVTAVDGGEFGEPPLG